MKTVGAQLNDSSFSLVVDSAAIISLMTLSVILMLYLDGTETSLSVLLATSLSLAIHFLANFVMNDVLISFFGATVSAAAEQISGRRTLLLITARPSGMTHLGHHGGDS